MATKAINMSSQTLQPDSPGGGQFDRIGVVAVDAGSLRRQTDRPRPRRWLVAQYPARVTSPQNLCRPRRRNRRLKRQVSNTFIRLRLSGLFVARQKMLPFRR